MKDFNRRPFFSSRIRFSVARRGLAIDKRIVTVSAAESQLDGVGDHQRQTDFEDPEGKCECPLQSPGTNGRTAHQPIGGRQERLEGNGSPPALTHFDKSAVDGLWLLY